MTNKITPERFAEIEAEVKAKYGDDAKLMHVTPAVDDACNHEWRDGEDGNPEQCAKCGISFTRYIFCCCP